MTEEDPRSSMHVAARVDAMELAPSMLYTALDIVCDKRTEGSLDEKRAEWLPLYFAPGRDGELHPQLMTSGEDPRAVLDRNVESTSAAQWSALEARAKTAPPHCSPPFISTSCGANGSATSLSRRMRTL